MTLTPPISTPPRDKQCFHRISFNMLTSPLRPNKMGTISFLFYLCCGSESFFHSHYIGLAGGGVCHSTWLTQRLTNRHRSASVQDGRKKSDGDGDCLDDQQTNLRRKFQPKMFQVLKQLTQSTADVPGKTIFVIV
jgi:hypothetical protein